MELIASAAGPLRDVPAIASIALLCAPGIVWLVSRFAPDLSAGLVIALCVVVAGASVFFLMLRAYGRQRRGEGVIFDRAADEVTRAGARLCALSELSCIEVRRDLKEEGPSFQVGLVVAGLRGRGAPRAAPSAFDDTVVVAESASEDAMRACAARIAAYARVRVEERGW